MRPCSRSASSLRWLSAGVVRGFEPCRELCRELLPQARAYAERFHADLADSLLQRLAEDQGPALPFDRSFWRQLAGEVLLFAAEEIPEFQTAADTWCCLLAPDLYRSRLAGIDPDDAHGYLGTRPEFAPIQQALWGSRDVNFGAAVYRPDHAGLNLAPDIERLTCVLDQVDPLRWTETDLARIRDVPSGERGEELAYAQEWFPVFRDLFRRMRQAGQVLVHERIF